VSNPLKTIFNSPVTPILAGAALAFEGEGHILLQSWGLLFCGLWFSYDLGRDIWQKPWMKQWKAIVFSLAFSLTFTLVLLAMYGLLQNDLSVEQRDVYQMLTITSNLPANADVLKSTSTVVNFVKTDIGKHTVYCIPKLVIFGNNSAIIGPESRLSVRDGLLIRAGHDAETEPCEINSLPFPKAIQCEDIIVGISYELSEQPTVRKDKQFRFVFNRREELAWHQQPVVYNGSYCDNDKISTAQH